MGRRAARRALPSDGARKFASSEPAIRDSRAGGAAAPKDPSSLAPGQLDGVAAGRAISGLLPPDIATPDLEGIETLRLIRSVRAGAIARTPNAPPRQAAACLDLRSLDKGPARRQRVPA